MITVPTHKRHKTPSEHSKTIYVFTSGRVIVIVQIHSTKKDFEWVKMATAKMDINNSEHSRIHAFSLQDLMKRRVCRCGVEMPLGLSKY
jgi:hypothetical protein